MEKITEVYIVHYENAWEIDVCASPEAAEQKGRNYLQEIANEFTKEEFDLIVAEFENSLREYEGVFSVEDIMWVEVQPVYY